MAPLRGGFWHGAAFWAALLLWAATSQAGAQTQGAGPEGILVLNQDALYAQSAFGQRVQRDLEQAGEALAAENRRIEAQLTAEELDLTEQRATMTPDAFRVLADEFDRRVGDIRNAQDAKAQTLSTQADAARQRFFELAFPILLELVQQRGAAVIVDSRSVLLSSENVDITAEALREVNARLGQGQDPVVTIPPSLETAPDPQTDTPPATVP